MTYGGGGSLRGVIVSCAWPVAAAERVISPSAVPILVARRLM